MLQSARAPCTLRQLEDYNDDNKGNATLLDTQSCVVLVGTPKSDNNKRSKGTGCSKKQHTVLALAASVSVYCGG